VWCSGVYEWMSRVVPLLDCSLWWINDTELPVSMWKAETVQVSEECVCKWLCESVRVRQYSCCTCAACNSREDQQGSIMSYITICSYSAIIRTLIPHLGTNKHHITAGNDIWSLEFTICSALFISSHGCYFSRKLSLLR
jgi:hypothetical protein